MLVYRMKHDSQCRGDMCITVTYPALAICFQLGAHEAVVVNGSHRLYGSVKRSNSTVALENGLANLAIP